MQNVQPSSYYFAKNIIDNLSNEKLLSLFEKKNRLHKLYNTLIIVQTLGNYDPSVWQYIAHDPLARLS